MKKLIWAFGFLLISASSYANTSAEDQWRQLEKRLHDDETKAWNILYPTGADITKESHLDRQTVKRLVRQRQFAEFSLQKAFKEPSEYNLKAADATISAYEMEIKKYK
jgi:hypothetical protein